MYMTLIAFQQVSIQYIKFYSKHPKFFLKLRKFSSWNLRISDIYSKIRQNKRKFSEFDEIYLNFQNLAYDNYRISGAYTKYLTNLHCIYFFLKTECLFTRNIVFLYLETSQPFLDTLLLSSNLTRPMLKSTNKIGNGSGNTYSESINGLIKDSLTYFLH